MQKATVRWKSVWVFFGTVSLVIGCAAGIQFSKEQLNLEGGLLFNGHVKTEVDCYRCHNGDGKGSGRGPDLSKVVPEMEDEHLLKVIAEGTTWMPAFSDKLTLEEQKQIVDWMRQQFGRNPKEAPVEVDAEALD